MLPAVSLSVSCQSPEHREKQEALCMMVFFVVVFFVRKNGRLEGKTKGDKFLGLGQAAHLSGCSAHLSYLCHLTAAS